MSYWSERQETMYKAGEMKVNQYFTKLEKAFNQTRRELQRTIEAFYFRYAKENGVTFAEAQKRLDKAEIGDLQDFIKLSMENIGKYNQEVNNLSIKARMTRYQALEMQIDAMLRKLYAVDYEAASEETMMEIYGDTYERTWYNIDQYRGFHSAFAQVNEKAVEKLLEYPFNGANFSSRLWKQKDHLQTVLMESVTTMLVQGSHPSTLTADFAKKMNSKKFDAYRLLHTEASFLMSEATHAGYAEDGVEKYQLLATLDSKTCGVCGELDNKVYLVSEAVVGKNMPPMHPLCRCTTVPYYDDTDLSDQTRAARDPETGKTYEVPAEMSYKEWKQTFAADNNPNYLIKAAIPGQNISKERLVTNRVIAKMPERIQKSMKDTTIIVGTNGRNQYDYSNDIMYLSMGTDEDAIIHEIGHLVESKILNRQDVESLKKRILSTVSPMDFVIETYYNYNGDSVDIFLVRSQYFVSEYQGRAYINDWSELLDENMHIQLHVMEEFISEPFREYIQNPTRMQKEFTEFYDLFERALK